jgi:7-cyano-7-deazaguanine reductase
MPPQNRKSPAGKAVSGTRSAYQASQPKTASLELPRLEIVSNPYAGKDYLIHFEIPEFNCVCPKTGLPDFATLYVDYVPGKEIIELKALKLYINGYRNLGVFHEAVANRVLDDLVAACKPKKARLKADFRVRGGIHTIIETNYKWENY